MQCIFIYGGYHFVYSSCVFVSTKLFGVEILAHIAISMSMVDSHHVRFLNSVCDLL